MILEICYDNPGNVPNKDRNFNTQKFGKMYLFVICMVSRHWFQTKLEWGCPIGTKYPPRQPIPNCAILPNRARLQTDGRTDGWTDRVIPVYPPNFVAGGIITSINCLILEILGQKCHFCTI